MIWRFIDTGFNSGKFNMDYDLELVRNFSGSPVLRIYQWEPYCISLGANQDFSSVDQEKTFYIKTKVIPQANLPADKGLFCVSNFVKADSSNAYDDDTSQLCIEKQVSGTTKVPSAGPELGLLLLAGNILGAGIGLKLRKRA